MPDVETVLETCFIELSKEYDIEEVDSIPRFEKKNTNSHLESSDTCIGIG